MIRKSRNGDFHLIDGGTHIDAWAEAAGRLDHDQNSLPRVLPYVPAGGIVVDAGAYIGDWTVALLEKVGPMGRVLAFEPNLEAFKCLQLNCPKAECYWSALSDRCGAGRLRFGSILNYGSCRVHPIEDGVLATEDDVSLVTLDSFELPVLSMLKADVEGGEYDLLLGAEATIRRCRPVMVIEVNESALKDHDGCAPQFLLELITSMDYSIENLYPRQEMSGGMFDVLCKPL